MADFDILISSKIKRIRKYLNFHTVAWKNSYIWKEAFWQIYNVFHVQNSHDIVHFHSETSAFRLEASVTIVSRKSF